MASLQPTHSSEAEKKYPLDFCLWLHKHFDSLADDLREKSSWLATVVERIK